MPVNRLWISVHAVENPLRACSGCAGDYEDPDLTAWEEDSGEQEPQQQEEEQ